MIELSLSDENSLKFFYTNSFYFIFLTTYFITWSIIKGDTPVDKDDICGFDILVDKATDDYFIDINVNVD